MKNRHGQVPSPNLLPQSRLTARRKDQALRRWSYTVIAMLLVIVVPSGMLSIHFRSSKPVDSDHITRFVSDLQQIQDAIPPLHRELIELQIASQSQLRAQSRVQWTSLLDHLASYTGKNVRIHSFDASIESSATAPLIRITIQTHTQSLSQAREFLVVLEQTGLFDEISMIESRRQSSAPDSPINSTIRAQIIAQPTTGTTP